MRVGQGALGPDDTLSNGRFGRQKCPGNLIGGETTEQAEGKCDSRFPGKDWVTGDEQKAQEIVSHGIVERRIEVNSPLLPTFELVANLNVLSVEHLVPAKQIDRPVLCRGHEPGAW